MRTGVKWLAAATMTAAVAAGGVATMAAPSEAKGNPHLAVCQEAANVAFDALVADSDGQWHASRANTIVYHNGGRLGYQAFLKWQEQVQRSYDFWSAADRDYAYDLLITCSELGR